MRLNSDFKWAVLIVALAVFTIIMTSLAGCAKPMDQSVNPDGSYQVEPQPQSSGMSATDAALLGAGAGLLLGHSMRPTPPPAPPVIVNRTVIVRQAAPPSPPARPAPRSTPPSPSRSYSSSSSGRRR